MKNIYKIIEEKIYNVLDEIGYHSDRVIVNESSRKDLGEYQYNGVMQLAKEHHINPLEIANKVVEKLQEDSFFSNVNIAGPGFINLSIGEADLINITNENDFSYKETGKTIFLDYGGANVAKSLHVGHLRSANIGESLKRLCNYLGYKTISDTHLGDWGRPLGLVILELSKRFPDWEYFNKDFDGEYKDVLITNEMLEEIYPYASAKSKEDTEYLKEAQEMTTRLQNREKGIYDLWLKIMDVSKTEIKGIYDVLNTEFDLYKGESDAEAVVPELLDYLQSINILEESEGAKVINVSEKDDKLEIPPMLIIKSDGGILYSTTELATIYDRIKTYNPDEIWYVVDQRQNLHFVQAFRAAYKTKIVSPDKNLIFAGFGTMNGSDGKPFKTRDGGVMKLSQLLQLVREESMKKLNSNIVEDREKIANIIAISAIKFADLLPNRESDYVFDISKFCDLEGKTGPYILYSTIRMRSLLNKAQEEGLNFDKITKINNTFDKEVLLSLNNFDNVLNSAFDAKSLNEITEYLYKLTTIYNRFYSENIVLKEQDEDLKSSWLALTKIVYKVNSILLNILAIEIPDKM